MKQLLSIMEQLRDPESGCPWDRKQTFKSIFPHTLEEVHEVADAIDREDLGDLKKELGDLLFQIVFYAQIAKEQSAFDFTDIVESISEKMVRRHPHVFSDTVYDTESEQKQAWEAIKQQERKEDKPAATEDFFTDIPNTLTSLQRGQKILNRASQTGFDWDDWRPVIEKVQEELEEIIEAVEDDEPHFRVEEEVGDLFIAATNLARHLNVDAENATRLAANKFAGRFNRVQQILRENHPEIDQPTLDKMEAAWQQVKQEEKQ